jgi:hypothetical protein
LRASSRTHADTSDSSLATRMAVLGHPGLARGRCFVVGRPRRGALHDARPERGGVDGGEDLLAGGVLGEVCGGARRQRLVDDLRLHERREQHQRDAESLTAEASDEVEAVGPGHAQVDERHIGALATDEVECRVAVGRLAGDLVAPGLDQRSNHALAEDRMVIGDDDALPAGRGTAGVSRCGTQGGGGCGHRGLLWLRGRCPNTMAAALARRHPPGGARRGREAVVRSDHGRALRQPTRRPLASAP